MIISPWAGNLFLSRNGPFPQSLRQAQILILDILPVCLRLKSSPSLTLRKIARLEIENKKFI